jgi:hypothetical protein
MEISVMMMKFVSAATILAAAAGAQGAFTFATHGFGDTAGQPYVTSNGSAFFVHSSRDNGEGVPDLVRPIHAANWATAAGGFDGLDVEWTTYVTESNVGPSHRSGGTDNSSDLFYLSRGVYGPGFTSANASSVSLGPGTNGAQALNGVIFGSSFIAGPPVASGPSPEGLGLQGIMLGRFTVAAGVTISGMPNLIGTAGDGSPINLNIALGGPAVDVGSGQLVALRAYLVAAEVIEDDGFDGDGEPFGASNTYDVWFTEVIPTPGAVALAGIAGLAGLRRRRA